MVLIPHILPSLIINNENQKNTVSRGYSKYPIGPYVHKTTAPQIWILNAKKPGAIKWNCSLLVNLELLPAILFNRKIRKHTFLTKKLEI